MNRNLELELKISRIIMDNTSGPDEAIKILQALISSCCATAWHEMKEEMIQHNIDSCVKKIEYDVLYLIKFLRKENSKQ